MPEAMYSHEEADALEAFILGRLQSSPGVRVARPFPPEERFLILPFFSTVVIERGTTSDFDCGPNTAAGTIAAILGDLEQVQTPVPEAITVSVDEEVVLTSTLKGTEKVRLGEPN